MTPFGSIASFVELISTHALGIHGIHLQTYSTRHYFHTFLAKVDQKKRSVHHYLADVAVIGGSVVNTVTGILHYVILFYF